MFPGCNIKNMNNQEDNESLQSDEIQALSSIYGSDWTIISDEERSYSVDIRNECSSIYLEMKLPPEYPLHSPPIYQLSAPWMDRSTKRQLTAELEEIYCNNIGESILYLWIEKAKEFLKYPSSVEEELVQKFPEENTSFCKAKSKPQMKELPVIQHSKPITDRKSVFQGHAAPVVSEQKVKEVLAELKRNGKISSAKHNIMAYRICRKSDGKICEDFDDDGEHKAGSLLLHMLQVLDVRNAMVVVTRWYGGIHLGADRFKHIKSSAKEALVNCGIVKDKLNDHTKSLLRSSASC